MRISAEKEKWLSGEALQIAVKRREVKSKILNSLKEALVPKTAWHACLIQLSYAANNSETLDNKLLSQSMVSSYVVK